MKVIVCFVNVVSKPEYRHGAERWLESYMRYAPQYEHKVVIIDRYADNPDDLFDKISNTHLRYDGGVGLWHMAVCRMEYKG